MRPANTTTGELLRLYRLAARQEYNLGAFLRGQPELQQALGVAVGPDADDAEIALQMAPAIGRYKRSTQQKKNNEDSERAEQAARRLVLSSRKYNGQVGLDVVLLLVNVLADNRKKYVGFEFENCRVAITRSRLLRARLGLRPFKDVTATVDEHGLYFRWHNGRGALNLKPQIEERGAGVQVVDLRRTKPTSLMGVREPVHLAEVFAGLALG